MEDDIAALIDRPDASELDLRELWATFAPLVYQRGQSLQASFIAYLREIVSDPDDIDEVAFCDNCAYPEWDNDLYAAGRSMRVCNTCWALWEDCNSCERRYPPSYLQTVLGGSRICSPCIGSYYMFCEHCDGYYPDDDEDDHDHEERDDSCCESPQLDFAIRNDGCEPLTSDTRVTVTLPSGVISAEGKKAIRDYLWREVPMGVGIFHSLAECLDKLGDQWQTRTGNFPKRLSRHAYKEYGLKLSPEALSQIGCIARDHSTTVSVAAVEVTRELNGSPGEFCHDDSCWWTSYRESRCALKTNGGFAVRTFNDDYDDAVGRAWVLPLRRNPGKLRRNLGKLTVTFDTMTPDAFVVFNGYRDLSGYAAPRILAHMTGWTYRKIDFTCNPMYVNGESGYLVASEEIADPYTDGSLRLTVAQHSTLFVREQAERDAATEEETTHAA